MRKNKEYSQAVTQSVVPLETVTNLEKLSGRNIHIYDETERDHGSCNLESGTELQKQYYDLG